MQEKEGSINCFRKGESAKPGTATNLEAHGSRNHAEKIRQAQDGDNHIA